MGLVMETDIGRDADDLFALLYFIGCGVKLDAICLTPGDNDQVALVKSILLHFNIDIPVFTPRARVSKPCITPFHQWVMTQTGNWIGVADGHEESLPTTPVEVFICGPAKMSHLLNATKITMQGGFVPYSIHKPVNILDKFDGITHCPTFNLGGTNKAISKQIIEANVPHRWVGKNICHTVVYTPEVHKRWCPNDGPETLRLHKLCVEKYIADKGAKAFHDPLAAVLSRHPELGIWMPLKPERLDGKYTAIPAENHESLVDLKQEPWELYFKGLSG